MKKKDPLFSLIKSLKKTEKTYFKKFTQLHTIGEKNNYVELFEFINEMTEYDEKLIIEKFKNETFAKQLHVIKNYLYNQILKSLRVYHTSANIDSKIREIIDYTSILHQKGFPNQAANYLIKAKKLAEEYEKHEYLLVVLRLEIRISSSDIYSGKKLLPANEGMSEIVNVLQKIQNINEYYSLTILLFEKLRAKGHIRDNEELKELNTTLEKPLLQSPEKANTFRSQIYFYYLLTVIYTEKNEQEKAIENAYKLVGVMENHPKQMEDEPSNYVIVLNHLIETLIHFKMYDDALPYMETLAGVAINSVYTEIRLLFRSFSLKLEVYLKTGKFEQGINAGKQLQLGLSKYEDKINEAIKTDVLFKLSHLYFGLGDYRTALYWINQLLNSKSKPREDISSFAALFSLIIHYELENTDLLEYHVKSTYSILFKRNRLFESEKLLIQFIKRLPKISTKAQLKEEFVKTHRQMGKILHNEIYILENNSLNYFDFYSWIESKITNEKYSEVIKKNLKSKTKSNF